MKPRRTKPLSVVVVVAILVLASAAYGAENSLADYRTVKTAITSTIQKQKTDGDGAAGFLGIEVTIDTRKRLVISDVAKDSPASRAGLQTGDAILQLGPDKPDTAEELRDWLQQKSAGESRHDYSRAQEREGFFDGNVERSEQAAETG